MHEQSKWHEAQPSASDEANALLLLSNLGRKHILMARSEAEGPNFKNYWFLSLKFGLKLDSIIYPMEFEYRCAKLLERIIEHL